MVDKQHELEAALELPKGALYLDVGNVATKLTFTDADVLQAVQCVNGSVAQYSSQAEIVVACEKAVGQDLIYAVNYGSAWR